MRDRTIHKLLEQVLGPICPDFELEMHLLRTMAQYKYDKYQRFSTGMRFLESFALWINQFAPKDRVTAYAFLKQHLIFISRAEIRHFIELAYADIIRPHLMALVAASDGYDRRHVGRIVRSQAFRLRERQTLFLGLSDGAHTDDFRRTHGHLSNEQIWVTYEVSDTRTRQLAHSLQRDTAAIRCSAQSDARFTTIVLLDDFTATGYSYMRRAGDMYEGKIARLLNRLADQSDPLAGIMNLEALSLLVVFYVGSDRAVRHIRSAIVDALPDIGSRCIVKVVQALTDEHRFPERAGDPVRALIEAEEYYDPRIFDKTLENGGTMDARYGYGGCGLPVVLSHNTPNNSLALLWSGEGRSFQGLFPRVQRHKPG